MSPRIVIAIAALLLLAGVAAGAFGAHALRGRLAADLQATYATAVQYHLVHALGLLVVGVLRMQWPDAGALVLASWLLPVGIVLFSGSLYALALTGTRGLGAITPLGGLAWLAAWAAVAWAAFAHATAR